MKTKILFLCIILFCCSCEQEFNVVPVPDYSIVEDGCDEYFYTYASTPVVGDPSSAYSKIDFYQVEALVNPIVGDSGVKKLSKQLVTRFSSPYEKVYAIYYWISLNMRYDYDMLHHEYICDWQNSATVLQRKKGVCEGISNLFAALCKNAGIGVVKIWGKSPGGLHAWNSVNIEGKWYLLDATWDLMYETKGKTYFLADPQSFYQTHIPNNSKWKFFGIYTI